MNAAQALFSAAATLPATGPCLFSPGGCDAAFIPSAVPGGCWGPGGWEGQDLAPLTSTAWLRGR